MFGLELLYMLNLLCSVHLTLYELNMASGGCRNAVKAWRDCVDFESEHGTPLSPEDPFKLRVKHSKKKNAEGFERKDYSINCYNRRQSTNRAMPGQLGNGRV